MHVNALALPFSGDVRKSDLSTVRRRFDGLRKDEHIEKSYGFLPADKKKILSKEDMSSMGSISCSIGKVRNLNLDLLKSLLRNLIFRLAQRPGV